MPLSFIINLTDFWRACCLNGLEVQVSLGRGNYFIPAAQKDFWSLGNS